MPPNRCGWRIRRRSARIELLLGRYPAAELKAREDLPALPGAVPAGLPIQMLERRPDMIAAERRVAAAFNRIGEAKAARLPKIVLNANIAVIDSSILQLKEDYENPSAGAGARLIAPIYQGGALKTQVVIRTLQQKEAVAQYARQALRALGDVENTLAANQTLAERNDLLSRSLADYQRALVLAKTDYRVGKTDFRTVQQQQLNVYAARLALLRVQSEQLAQRANLHLVLGGSFEKPPDPPPAWASSRASTSSTTSGGGRYPRGRQPGRHAFSDQFSRLTPAHPRAIGSPRPTMKTAAPASAKPAKAKSRQTESRQPDARLRR